VGNVAKDLKKSRGQIKATDQETTLTTDTEREFQRVHLGNQSLESELKKEIPAQKEI